MGCAVCSKNSVHATVADMPLVMTIFILYDILYLIAVGTGIRDRELFTAVIFSIKHRIDCCVGLYSVCYVVDIRFILNFNRTDMIDIYIAYGYPFKDIVIIFESDFILKEIFNGSG